MGRFSQMPLVVALLLPACTTSPLPSDAPQQAYRLPFELDGGHIYLRASLNNTPPRWFVLDSGSTHTIVDQSQAKALGLKPGRPTEIRGIGNRRIPATFAAGVPLTTAGISWSSSEMLVVPSSFFTPLQQFVGRDFSGIIGADLFERFVVEVDYQAQTLRLYDPSLYRYQGTGHQIPLKLRRQKPYVKGTIQVAPKQQFKGQLLVDLGSGAALDINEPLTPKVHQLLTQQPSLPRLTLGVGGKKNVQIGRMQTLKIKDLTLNAPVTEFSLERPPRQQKMSGRLGGKILRQFRVILNYDRKRLILEPQTQAKRQNYDMSGLWLRTEGAPFKQIWVEQVFAQSPAAAAGIEAGDRILSINGQSDLSLSQVRDRLSQPGTYQLQLQRQGQTRSIRLTLKPLI